MTAATPIRREVTIGSCRLILGDMQEVLPYLRDRERVRARLVLTDPPYPLTAGGSTTGGMGGCFARGRYNNSGALFDIVSWADMAPLIDGTLCEDADAIIMTSDREISRASGAFSAAGFGFHRLLVWDKVTATPNRWFMPNVEFALYLYKGRARRIVDCGARAMVRVRQGDVSQHFHDAGECAAANVAHATEKPVALMRYWMENASRPGELVVDPFMGTGSTLLAAARAGRPAIGIEKNEVWFSVAVNRLRSDMAEPGLPIPSPDASEIIEGVEI